MNGTVARWTRLAPLLWIALLGAALIPSSWQAPPTPVGQRYIVQGANAALAAAAVQASGGQITRPLAIVDGVLAELDPAALARLRTQPDLRLTPDGSLYSATAQAKKETDTAGYLLYPAAATQARLLHSRKVQGPKLECKEDSDKRWRVLGDGSSEERPLRGWGVTIAVIDSGFMRMASPSDWTFKDRNDGTLLAANSGRCIVYRDFLPRIKDGNPNDNFYTSLNAANSTDQQGHGTHVVSTIGDNRETPLASGSNASAVGVAPDANLLIARALDKNGAGAYSDVITAIEWIISQRNTYNVRVLNLSLYAPVGGPYWSDPLNHAVMKAWQAGITVVAAAGNEGPTAGTITVPGNLPYVITVGAVKSGRYTASGSDDLASYSSRGPTESAFVKPDVVIPSTRTIAPMPNQSALAVEIKDGRIQEKANVDYKIGAPAQQHTYYQLSGTSMAAAQVSGIVALMLQANPQLTNDQVKYRLLATARPAFVEPGEQLAYSIWEQGAGLVDSRQAVFTTTLAAANAGMDIALDLDPTGTEHYWGNTIWDPASGQFQLVDPTTGELLVWDSGKKSWSSSSLIWSGGKKSWSSGTTSWASSESLWAGSTLPWAGTTPLTNTQTAAMRGELPLRAEDEPEPSQQQLALPLLIR